VSLSICIVGCGEQAGKILDEALPVLDDVSLYFTSEYLSDARRYNDTYGGVGVFDSFEDAVRDPGVDAVYLATPHHLHLGHTLIAAAQRKHILVEKPIAMTVPEAWRMISCARDSGVVLMVSEPVRYLSTVDKCNELIADGEIGDLRLVHVQNQAFDIPLEWRTDASLRGGGELIDGGIHSIDILVNIGGLPEKVYAVLPNRLFGEVDGDDGAVMTARLPGGVYQACRAWNEARIDLHERVAAIGDQDALLTVRRVGDHVQRLIPGTQLGDGLADHVFTVR